jgi:aryl-alcohol dehydrogenase-like predicted oxidoreductase
LKRLKTDRLDLIQLHSCSEEELRKGAVIEALQTARKKGYARYLGYSGDSLAARYAVETGVFDALQTSVNILDQEAIEVVLPLARQAGVGVIAKRPIANAVWRYSDRPGDSDHARYWDRMRTLAYDFIPTDESSAAATALRFTLMTPGVHTAIVGTTRPERWTENAASLEPGPLPISTYESIRARWAEVAPASWVGQT